VALFGHTGKPNRWTQHDTGAASVSMALQAVALGLIIHQMGGYDPEKARAAFGIPAEYTPMAMIAVGYQAEPEILDEETKAKELRPRTRKAVTERFYEGGWEKPVAL
jgi:nitroreductase